MSFWYLQFFQKRTKKFKPNYYGTSSRIIFIRFLKELKTPKRHFETNWPLTWLICFLKIGYVTTAYLHPWIDWMKCHSWIKIRYLSTYLLTYLVSMNFIRNCLTKCLALFCGIFHIFLNIRLYDICVNQPSIFIASDVRVWLPWNYDVYSTFIELKNKTW